VSRREFIIHTSDTDTDATKLELLLIGHCRRVYGRCATCTQVLT